MQANQYVLSNLNIASSLGLHSKIANAAAFAGLKRLKESGIYFEDMEEWSEPVPLYVHSLPEFKAEGFQNLGRLVRIMELALNTAEKKEYQDADGIVLCFSDRYYWQKHYLADLQKVQGNLKFSADEIVNTEQQVWEAKIRNNFLPLLCNLTDLEMSQFKNTRFLFGQQTSVIDGIQEGIQLLESFNLKKVLIGVVDSLLDERTLQVLLTKNLLKKDDNVGFFPGEAGGFLVLEHANRTNKPVDEIVHLRSIVSQSSAVTRLDDAYEDGITLSNVILQSNFNQFNVKHLFSNLNGDPWRAVEWGNSMVHVQNEIGNLPLTLPCENYGETGAATGLTCVSLALHSYERNFVNENDTAIVLSGDNGKKATLVIGK